MKFPTCGPMRWDSRPSATQCMTLPMSALELIPLSTAGRVTGKVSDFSAETDFGQLGPMGGAIQAQWDVSKIIAPALTITTSRTCHLVSKPGSDCKVRLERPTPQDWKRWRPKIVRQYQEESALQIVDRLRREGYHVTYTTFPPESHSEIHY